jgi:hypothetical protein
MIAVGYKTNSERATQLLSRFNDAEVLEDKGKVTAAIAKEFAESEFEKYRVIQDLQYQSDFDRLVNSIENKEY